MADVKLLYIEDEPEQRQTLAASLEERGFVVATEMRSFLVRSLRRGTGSKPPFRWST